MGKVETMIDIEIKHDIQKNYLVIHGTKELAYMLRMVSDRTIQGFLPLEVRVLNNINHYYYDITGRENLLDRSKKGNWGLKQIVHFFVQILNVIGKAKEYLLNSNNFVLEPAYIYENMCNGEIAVCYYSDYEKDINGQLTELFSYFMNVVDYKDTKAVELVYKLYDVSREEHCTLQRLWNVIGERQIEEERKEESVTLPEENKKNKRSLISGQRTGKYGLKIEDKLLETKEGKRNKFSLVSARRIEKNKVKSQQKGETKALTKKIDLSVKEKNFFLNKLGKKNKNESKSKEKRTENKLERKERDTTSDFSDGTVVLEFTNRKQEFQEENLGVSESECYLIPDTDKHQLLSLNEFPFFIGRVQQDTEEMKKNLSISRMHSKIEKFGERFFITDLNSTNGTYINQNKVNSNESIELHEGDKIQFANVTYFFSKENKLVRSKQN